MNKRSVLVYPKIPFADWAPLAVARVAFRSANLASVFGAFGYVRRVSGHFGLACNLPRLLIALAALSLFLHLDDARADSSAKIDIVLGAATLKEPLVECVLPPKESGDTMVFSTNGLLIKQLADKPGIKTGVAGFKVLANIAGDFSFQLDFDCLTLSKPTKGWGQGLVIRILTDDKNAPIIAFGCIATPTMPQAYWMQFTLGEGKKPERVFLPANFKSGSWVVSRSRDNISLTVQEGKEALQEVFRHPCTKASLQGIHVWSVRQEKGNTEAEFLLKRIQLSATQFFSYKEANQRSLWGWVIGAIITIVSIGGVLIMVRNRKILSNPASSKKA